MEPSKLIDTNTGPAIVVTSASDDELINLGQCRLHVKLGEKTFEYYFQILKNLKQDLNLGCEVHGPKPQTLGLFQTYFNF